MIAKEYRLAGTYYIDRAKSQGKIFQFPDFGLCVFLRRGEDDGKLTKFAFVVSTKVSKHAVDRNRIKRVLNETVRYETQHLRTGYDVVFLTKKSITTRPTDKIMYDIKQALRTAHLMD